MVAQGLAQRRCAPRTRRSGPPGQVGGVGHGTDRRVHRVVAGRARHERRRRRHRRVRHHHRRSLLSRAPPGRAAFFTAVFLAGAFAHRRRRRHRRVAATVLGSARWRRLNLGLRLDLGCRRFLPATAAGPSWPAPPRFLVATAALPCRRLPAALEPPWPEPSCSPPPAAGRERSPCGGAGRSAAARAPGPRPAGQLADLLGSGQPDPAQGPVEFGAHQARHRLAVGQAGRDQVLRHRLQLPGGGAALAQQLRGRL